jgi:Rrf2 family transcriptional regulator, iron-sulfur cluster assembly transcription factor
VRPGALRIKCQCPEPKPAPIEPEKFDEIPTNFTGATQRIMLSAVMFRYGKLARQAVSALSYLAEHYQPQGRFVSSSEVGRERKIPSALAAKLLSQMAGAGLATGITGPGGGYRLTRDPSRITLAEIVNLFEREMEEFPCPFGSGWCGTGKPCPLHEDFLKLEENGGKFLRETTLAVFAREQDQTCDPPI